MRAKETVNGGNGAPTGSQEQVSQSSEAPQPTEYQKKLVEGINPTNSDKNCVGIVEALDARMSGDEGASALHENVGKGNIDYMTSMYGKENFHNYNVQKVFDAVQAGGDGTRMIMYVKFGPGTEHAVMVYNDHGVVGVLEGQSWDKEHPAGVITDPKVAEERYGQGYISTFSLPKVEKR